MSDVAPQAEEPEIPDAGHIPYPQPVAKEFRRRIQNHMERLAHDPNHVASLLGGTIGETAEGFDAIEWIVQKLTDDARGWFTALEARVAALEKGRGPGGLFR